jgi:hypothetical protein
MVRMWWLRLGSVSGVIAVVLAIAGVVPAPRPPGWTEKIPSIELFLYRHRVGLEAGQLLTSLSSLFLLVFAVYLWTVFRSTDEDAEGPAMLSLLGAAATVVLSWVQSLLILTLSYMAIQANVDFGVRALFDLSVLIGYFIIFATVVFLGASAAIIVASAVLPRWLGWAAAVIAAASLLAASVGLFHPHVADSVVALILYLLILLWIAVASVILALRVWPLGTIEQPSTPVPLG